MEKVKMSPKEYELYKVRWKAMKKQSKDYLMGLERPAALKAMETEIPYLGARRQALRRSFGLRGKRPNNFYIEDF